MMYQLTVPMSGGMLALGWAAFFAIDAELRYWYADPETAVLEYRHHGHEVRNGIVTTFRVTRDRGTT